ncbi:type I restriction endonuclease subunit R [Micromonospora rubida]|uniref:Type I restriction enzyme endonuclease subunit n=1 Tax=Micromonospora rubida TaxID=2697657 RepID=A0ABW7SF88_9ACTN
MVAGFNEANSVQAPILDLLRAGGWTYVPGDQLDRSEEQPLIELDVLAALVRLNPVVAEDRSRADEVLARLRMLTLTAGEDGLVPANRTFLEWLKGRQSHQFTGTAHDVPIQLIDFSTPKNNNLVVSDEVTFGAPGNRARFDIVLWVNGFPLVVGEVKTAVDQRVSWVKGAKEISEVYEIRQPQIFVPNVLSFASEGREFFYGPVGAAVSDWEAWGSTSDPRSLTGWKRVQRCVETLLTPRTVLDMLHDFTVYETAIDPVGNPQLVKIIARYPQYEAVHLIAERARDGVRRRGLVHHTQGSGKTLAMVFAAAKMLTDPKLTNPTIIMIADRLQLVRQTYDQFRTTSMPRLESPATAAGLRSLLGRRDKRGLIFTTVHKFAGAGVLNGRDNIIVLIDEAHRSQEKQLGGQMRQALPNARFFGFTGTPIADLDRNTFALYGDPDDPGQVLHRYDSDRSITDGMTVPIHVNPRLVEFQLDKQRLDEAFTELAATEGLAEDEAEFLAKKVSRTSTFFANPERIEKVCADIVEHFYATINPLGMKAQIVVVDRDLCVKYATEINRLLALRYDVGHPLDECAIVMSVQSKDDEDWRKYALSEAEEEKLLDRFRAFGDPMKFLIVTSKLGIGFNAPIEGVMYLDKPLKLHTLFQTITRANRPWKNPQTGQEKRYGLICDYIGLGDGFAHAMAPANPQAARREIELDGLIDQFAFEIAEALDRFAGIDRTIVGAQTLQDAHQRIPDSASRDRFAARFQMLQGIWEMCFPDARLEEHRVDYRFLSQVYASVMPTNAANELLWHRLGAKTLDLVHSHIGEVTVRGSGRQAIIADADTIRTLIEEGLIPQNDTEVTRKTAGEVIDDIAGRIRRRLAGPNGDHEVYRSLSERLDRLRERVLTQARDSIEYLRELFTLAKDVTSAEQAEDTTGKNGLDLLPDPHVGALTQIFNEYAPKDTPVIIGRVVADIDTIVKEIRYDGWSHTQNGDRLVRISIRKVLQKYYLPASGELFDHAHAYIAEHY